MSLSKNMRRIAQAVNQKDWDGMKAFAHSLKGACGYVGASHLHYACYYIQEAYTLNQMDKMLEKYPKLVETAVEFKRYSRKILAEYRGKI